MAWLGEWFVVRASGGEERKMEMVEEGEPGDTSDSDAENGTEPLTCKLGNSQFWRKSKRRGNPETFSAHGR